MVILKQATIKYKGYDPEDLKDKSNLRICCSCDMCGRVSYKPKQGYRNLCSSCATKNRPPIKDSTRKKLSELNSGKNNSMYDKQPSIETRKKMSDAHKGEKHYLYGKSMLEKTKQKISNTKIKNESHKGKNNSNYGKRGKDASGWKGGNCITTRPYLTRVSQATQLNKRFKESHFHHITKSLGVYIPRDLHYHINHNLKNGEGMVEMNMLSLQFINGGL